MQLINFPTYVFLKNFKSLSRMIIFPIIFNTYTSLDSLKQISLLLINGNIYH